MKKIFWTTVFWLLVIFLFRSYMRLFNTSLGLSIGSRFGKVPQQTCLSERQVCLTGNDTSGLTNQLAAIQTQLDSITQKLQSEPETTPQTSVFQTTSSTKVALYYFNQTEDQKLVPAQQINVDSILPVYRIFPATQNLLIDTINELIK